jgi:hypothetical protein
MYGACLVNIKRRNKMIEIQKNSREIIRIGESEYEGHKFVDCRIYFDDNGEWNEVN